MKIAISHRHIQTAERLQQLVENVPGFEVIWLAATGGEALQKSGIDRPEMLLIDIELCHGTMVSEIMKKSPCTILLLVEGLTEHASKIYEMMGHGAVDVMNFSPDVFVEESYAQELLGKIRRVQSLSTKDPKKNTPIVLPHTVNPPLVVIGASTGGPGALLKVLAPMQKECPASFVIVQHVDEGFAQGLAKWLDDQTALSVKIAEEGMHPEPGVVFLAKTTNHLVLTKSLTFHYTAYPTDLPYRPSVDVLFNAVSNNWPEPGVALLLTGMGRDGAAGMKELRDKGWHTIAQARQDCVVYGMPKAAYELGAAVEVLTLEHMAEAVKRKIRRVK